MKSVRSHTRLVAAIVSVSGLACLPENEAPEPERRLMALIDHASWSELPAADDPLPSHAPAVIDCGIAGWLVEEGGLGMTLEVDTNFCNYASLSHPTLVALEAGDTIQIELFHFDLTSPEPAVAHLAFFLGGESLWETEIDVPGAANVIAVEVESPRDFDAGTPMTLHLHNHGQNTWNVGQVQANVLVP